MLAAFDLHAFANALNAPGMLANLNPVTTITCVNIPTACTINIVWNEHAVAINAQTAAAALPTAFSPSYTLYVEP